MEFNPYLNAKIYGIYSPAGKPYIGSTCLSLKRRLYLHRKNQNTSATIHLAHPNHYIQTIEEYPCANRTELLIRENYYQRTIPCCNILHAVHTPEDRAISKHKHYLKHIEHIKQHAKEKIQCECGASIARRNIASHRRRKYHNRIINAIQNTQTTQQTTLPCV